MMLPGRLFRLFALGGMLLLAGCSSEPSGPDTGSLDVTVAGVPTQTNVVLLLQGPAGGASAPTRTLAGSGLVSDLPAGSYTLTALPASVGATRYDPSPASQPLSITKSTTPLRVTITYALGTGGIAITVTGVPFDATTPLLVTGPQGYSQGLTKGQTLMGLDPGTYTVSASDVLFRGNRYAPEEPSQSVAIAAVSEPADVTVEYLQITGALQVAITGVPCGEAGNVQVTGPDGVQTVLRTSTLNGLRAGLYTIEAQPVIHAGRPYQPSPGTQQIQLDTGATASATVSYGSGGAPGVNFTIDGAYVVQIVQRPDGGVPLIAGKPGLLRTFVASVEPSAQMPPVRARFYRGGALVDTRTIAPPATSAACAEEGTLASTWNEELAASFITTGLSVLLDVDPDNTIAESDEGDNVWPTSGQPYQLDVRATPPMSVRFVPVTQSATGLTGGVNASTVDNFIAFARKLFPFATINVDVRPPYTTSTPALQNNDANHAWTTILNELNVLRTADGATQHYFGVVKVEYGSGIAGYGYVPGFAAIGWDYLPSGQLIVAHELGHNLGRFHAPCGGAASTDPNFPYPGGVIGVYGWDPAFKLLRTPSTTDLMGYCGFQWISDYNYEGIIDFLEFAPTIAAAARLPRPSLIVWGRRDRGQLVLEPAFAAVTAPSLPSEAGPFRIEGLDANGRVLFTHSFAGEHPAHAEDPDARQFAFAVPLSPSEQASLASLRLSDGARTVVRRAATAASIAGASVDLREVTRGGVRARLRWTAPAPLAVVRDAATGQIVALARDGDATLTAPAGRELIVELSDGVRSGAARRLRVERRQ
ncbi:MAG TPA: hypothetical protein VFG84_10350 [Gemmatimonadaceae bacterium]|nr:hypothetical protein [Gemmatimonadaceae bacterium]